MLSNKRITILTSFYNMDSYLETFLSNFRNQSVFEECKMIFINNSPNDYNIEILHSFNQLNEHSLEIINLSQRESYSDSINRAFTLCETIYAVIWNVDDFRFKNSLELQLTSLETSGSDISFGKFLTKIHRHLPLYISSKKTAPTENDMLTGMHLGPFFMFRTAHFIQLYDTKYQVCADFDFAMKSARSGLKFIFIENYLGTYTNFGAGLSTNQNSPQLLETIEILEKYSVGDANESYSSSKKVLINVYSSESTLFKFLSFLILQYSFFVRFIIFVYGKL
jgi:hypothetical protein